MSVSASGCYDRDCLAAWALGRLESQRFEEVSAHLERCASCQQAVAAFDGIADPLVQLLREPLPVPRPLGENAAGPQASTISHVSATDTFVPGASPPPFPQGLPGIEMGELLGKGGMGQVYKARHVRLNRFVAVKVMSQPVAHGDDAHKRFEREMQVLAQLDHPNIVRIHHADEANGRPYLVMDFLEGVSLSEHVRQRGPLPVTEACALARQAALGLQHAHERGAVHRDVKPSNLLRTRDGVVKLLDLGLARWILRGDGGETLTVPGAIMGTPGFVAPEQVSDPHSAGAPADVFSLGCTLYFLLTGECPFPGSTVTEKLEALARMSPKPLAALRPDCPKEIVNMVANMMDRRPTARCASAGLVAERLRPFCLEDASGSEKLAPVPAGSLRRRWPVWAAVALVALVAGLGLWLGLGQSVTVKTPQGTLEHRSTAVAQQPKGGASGVDDGLVGEIASMSGGRDVDLVRFSPTTRSALTSESGPLRIWDLEKRRLLTSWGSAAHRSFAPHVFTPDGRFVVIAPQLVISDPVTGKPSGKLIREWKEATLHDMSFSANGNKWFLTAQFNGFLRLWTLPAGKLYREFKHGTVAVTACLTPDGKFILSGGNDNVVRLWDIEKDRQEKTYEGHEKPVLLVRLLADGKRFVSVSRDGKVIVWDLNSGKKLHKLSLDNSGAYNRTIQRLAVAPEGRRLLAGHAGGSISLWDLDKGERVSKWAGHKNSYVRAVDITPDGRYALSVGSADQLLRYWRLPAVPGGKTLPEGIVQPAK